MRFNLLGSSVRVGLLGFDDGVCNFIAAVLLCQHVSREPDTPATQAESLRARERLVKRALPPLSAASIPLLQQNLELFTASENRNTTLNHIMSCNHSFPSSACLCGLASETKA